MIDFLKAYKSALYFLLIFLGLYLTLNSLYGVYINSYYPAADPITINITQQVAIALSWFYQDITIQSTDQLPSIMLLYKGAEVINVFEGCNGLNVMIVYLSFLFAFSGKTKSTVYFLVTGITILYLTNLLRVLLLFGVALHFPHQLYFFHKYFFTGLLYLFVFLLWFVWIKRVKREKAEVNE